MRLAVGGEWSGLCEHGRVKNVTVALRRKSSARWRCVSGSLRGKRPVVSITRAARCTSATWRYRHISDPAGPRRQILLRALISCATKPPSAVTDGITRSHLPHHQRSASPTTSTAGNNRECACCFFPLLLFCFHFVLNYLCGFTKVPSLHAKVSDVQAGSSV